MLSPAVRALLERLRRQPRRLHEDPAAVVGRACRLPGAPDIEGLWRLLREGRCAVREVPPERWDVEAWYDPDFRTAGRMSSRWGSWLEDVDLFDAAFFGISAREAEAMDPQHRLLLEVTQAALDDAGLTRAELAGSRTGVFVGVYQRDYARLALADREAIDAYTTSGSHHSIAANRLSYLLDLRGPSLCVDTACSTSLVALHLACRSLLHGECDRALVAAANLVLSPEESVSLSRWGMLAGDGLCKTFDASADGFVRGEGCAALVLERSSDAREAGRRVRGLVRGSAVNQDGRSNGLTAPRPQAQEAVLRQALGDAALAPSELGYVEAHGTGTALGDPIEVQALAQVLGASTHPGCVLGSIKSNLGHLEACAGLAGVLKALLCLEHGELVPSLHLRRLNPELGLEPGGALRVGTQVEPWSQRRVAGVSAFGMGGTNAHVVLGSAEIEAEEAPGLEVVEAGPLVLPLSAPDPAHLEALVQSWSGMRPPDAAACAGAWRYRSEEAARAVFVADGPEGLQAALEAGLGALDPRLQGQGQGSGGVVFLFPGQGGQWEGMARELLVRSEAFRAELEACDEVVREEAGWSLLDTLAGGPLPTDIQRVQPLLCAWQLGLAALWSSLGVEPAAVVGHSMGELAAACVAGALSRRDALRVVLRRTALMARLRGQGAMLALAVGEDEGRAFAEEEGLSLAVVNGPRSVVLSGDEGGIARLEARLLREGAEPRRIAVEVASHHAGMEALAAELHAALSGLSPKPLRVPMHSTVTAAPLRGDELDGRYWAANLRQPVRLWEVVQGLAAQGFTRFVELGPHPLLLSALGEGLPAGTTLLPSSRRDAEWSELLRSAGTLWVQGLPLRWEAALQGPASRSLPPTPLLRRRFWLRPPPPASSSEHPTLGAGLALAHAPGEHCFPVDFDPRRWGWLRDHAVEGRLIVPGTAAVELFWAAQRRLGRPSALADLRFERAVLLDGNTGSLQLHVDDAGLGLRGGLHPQVQLHSRASHASPGARPRLEPERIQARCTELREDLYARLLLTGNRWEGAFQGVARLWRRKGEVLAELRVPEACRWGGHLVHPALLDACGQALTEAVDQSPESLGPFVLASIEGAELFGGEPRWSHLVLREDCAPGTLVADVEVADASGLGVARLRGLCIRFVHQEGRRPPTCEEEAWRPARLELLSSPAPRILGEGHLARTLAPLGGAGAPALVLDGEDPVAACSELLREATRPFWLVTRGALPGQPPVLSPAAAAAVGLWESLRAERPELALGRVDLDPAGSPASAAQALAELGALPRGEPRFAHREGRWWVPRLVGSRAPSGPSERPLRGSTLVTGAFGGVGRRVASRLAQRGARLLLLGRHPDPDFAASLGAVAVRGDVADRSLLADLAREHELRGVVHAAGVQRPGPIEALDAEALRWGLHAKVEGARALLELPDLDFLVFFSSAATLLPSPLLGAYAAANAWLEAAAVQAHAQGRPVVAVSWGLWAGGGMAERHAARAGRGLEDQGFRPLDPEAALDLLERLLVADLARIAPVGVDWARWAALHPAAASDPLFAERVQTGGAGLSGSGVDEPGPWLLQQIASVLHLQEVDPRQAPTRLGMDSLMALELRNRLIEALDLALPVMDILRAPSCAALVELVERAGESQEDEEDWEQFEL